jgi:WD40-like Beta Propeller Repeat
MGARKFLPVAVVAAVSIFAACVGDDPSSSPAGGDDGGSSDGSISDGSKSDAISNNDTGVGDSGGGGCNLDLPFVTPSTRVNFAGDAAITTVARLTRDELNAVLNRDPDGGHLGIASRGDPSGVFGPIQEITSIETGSNEFVGSLTGDGQTLYYQNDTTPFPHIWSATAGSGVANFTGAQNISSLNSASFDGEPYISADNTELWFTSSRNGNEDLFVTENTGAGFSTARAVDELNSASIEQTPAITGDKLTVYFTRYNTFSDGGVDVSNPDVWVAHRATTTSTFTSIARVTEIDTPGGEYMNWVSPDGCRLYYSSDYALYVVAKPAK